jgi:TonB family protein
MMKRLLFLLSVLACGLVSAYAQIKLSPEEAEKLILEKPNPVYPPIAEKAQLQGKVKVRITVSEKGAVTSATSVSGHILLFGAAKEAAMKRKYKPYQITGKPSSFSTTVDIQFSVGIPPDEYEKELETARQFFEKEEKCRSLLRNQKWQDAELTCKEAVAIANRLPQHRALEKMGAYEAVGNALFSQRRFQEALDHYSRAFIIGQTTLSDTDAETGYAYRNLGVTNHMLGNLDKAREFYSKAEKTLQHAYDHIGLEDVRPGYLKTLRSVLQYHLLAAQESGAEKEAEEIKKRPAKLP